MLAGSARRRAPAVWPVEVPAYLLTDQAVTDTATRYVGNRPSLDEESQRAILAPGNPRPAPERHSSDDYDSPDTDAVSTTASAEETLWLALCMAPDEGADIGELMRMTGMSRPTLYRHLAQHARAGRAVQIRRGHWRATTTGEPHGE